MNRLRNRFLLFFLVVSIFPAFFCAEGQTVATLVLTGGKVYPSPTAALVEDAKLLIQDGKIVRVDPSAYKNPFSGSAIVNENGRMTLIAERGHVRYDLGRSPQMIDCKGKVIVAGFWNSHAHFESGWQDAANQTADKLEAHMQEMLTKWGVTTVWDLGSLPSNTLEIRRKVEAGEVPGPKILMAGDIFPKNGHPVYLPPEMQLPEAASAQEAKQMAEGYLKQGFDGVKLFTGAYMGNKPVINMDEDIVKAAVDVAHKQGKPVFAHPQNYAGTDSALAGGVDILAHTIPTEGHFTDDELARMKRQHTALIPTLTLWTTVVSDHAIQDQLVQAGVSELKQYFSQGGTILFGTDVGFTSKDDTTQEFEFMGRAMPWKDVLASLTTNPSSYFKASGKGKVEKGMDADLVVLDADPADDVKNLAKVAYTIRGGKIIYQEK